MKDKIRNNYLIFHNPYWVSLLPKYAPIKIKGKIRVYVNKDNHTPDKRTKEYRELIAKKPRYYHGIKAKVGIGI